LLTRYDDVRHMLSDPRFSSRLNAADAARASDTDSGGAFANNEATDRISGEGHLRWRRLVGKWFTAKRMNALRPRIAAMADGLIDEMLERSQPGDLVSALGFPVPVWVICHILGVPDADRFDFARWSDALLSLTRHTQEEMEAAHTSVQAYLTKHVADKRDHPGDDLLSGLLTVVDAEDGRLSSDELVFTAMTLLVAGHETTANMIGKMVAMLLADRRRWERLLADPSLIRPAVEEALRFDANFGFGVPRYLSEEFEVGGATLPAGTTVVCSIASANRDEDAFDGADTLDVGRSPNPHITFGVGPHSCIGQALARTELNVVLEVLLRRLPSLELAIPARDLPRRDGFIVGGIERLPVRW
jgi:cytochrome P450